MGVLLLKKHYLSQVKQGRKRSTIRLGARTISIGPLTLLSGKDRVKVTVTDVTHKAVAELTEDDATCDGFNSRNELLSALTAIYPTIAENDVVTIVHFVSEHST